MRNLVLFGALVMAASASARPPEAEKADRAAATIELADLDRRAASLDEQVGLRQRMLKRRVRSLYKLTQGGALRLVVEAKDVEEVGARLDAAHRVIARDLHELGALGEELRELAHDKVLRSDKAAALSVELPRGPKVGLERRRGFISRPVAGVIVGALARTRVAGASRGAASLEIPRRTVELATSPGESVQACAAGTVLFVGPVDGLGQAVVIDHGDHYATFTARLRSTRVVLGGRVQEGESIGRAASTSIAFELSESRTALDPAVWLRAPHVVLPGTSDGAPIPDGPAHAAADLVHPASL
ncbi:MAG: M23 family metallopeptidase [Polyangia bacterium]